VAPDTGVMLAASLQIPTRGRRGTARNHPRARIIGSSRGRRVAANIAALLLIWRRQYQPTVGNRVGIRSFFFWLIPIQLLRCCVLNDFITINNVPLLTIFSFVGCFI